MGTPQPPPIFSDDGMWWWDGQTWKPAVSADGQLRWDGSHWRPVAEQQVPQPSADEKPTGSRVRNLPVRSIKIAGAAAAIVALVAVGSLLLTHVLSPQVVSGSGYTFQVPPGWSWYRPSDPQRPCGVAPLRLEGKGKAIDIAQHPILPDVNFTPASVVCGPHQEGSDEYYAIYVYAGVSLDQLSFKPPPPWATPGYDAKIPIAFPGSTSADEAECTDVGTFPLFCRHVPGGQKSDSVDRNPPMCAQEDPNPATAPPNVGVWFAQLGRFVGVTHASRNYLIVLSGYKVPIRGFPELYCTGFYQMLQSWKWQG